MPFLQAATSSQAAGHGHEAASPSGNPAAVSLAFTNLTALSSVPVTSKQLLAEEEHAEVGDHVFGVKLWLTHNTGSLRIICHSSLGKGRAGLELHLFSIR